MESGFLLFGRFLGQGHGTYKRGGARRGAAPWMDGVKGGPCSADRVQVCPRGATSVLTICHCHWLVCAQPDDILSRNLVVVMLACMMYWASRCAQWQMGDIGGLIVEGACCRLCSGGRRSQSATWGEEALPLYGALTGYGRWASPYPQMGVRACVRLCVCVCVCAWPGPSLQ